MKVFFIILCVFAGCCSNVYFLELLVKEDPGSGNLITFSQFIFIALIGFIRTSKFGTAERHIQIKDYMIMTAMFFITNVFNNYAFDLNIPMPLHMIFRAGSLIANMIMGIIILKKRYRLDKYISVGMITFGIAICTIISGQKVSKSVGQSTVTKETSELEDFFWWSVGIACLTLALFVSARMGIYQEVLYKKHGKYPNEALYYTHLLPLPGFLVLSSNLWEHLSIAVNSRPIFVPVINLPVPCIIAYLIGNVVTQFVCISSVYHLTTECSSLTVTLVITLRKFISLLFSILWFRNPFTIYHWIGTIAVFVGTVIFTELPQKMQSSMAPKKVESKKKKT